MRASICPRGLTSLTHRRTVDVLLRHRLAGCPPTTWAGCVCDGRVPDFFRVVLFRNTAEITLFLCVANATPQKNGADCRSRATLEGMESKPPFRAAGRRWLRARLDGCARFSRTSLRQRHDAGLRDPSMATQSSWRPIRNDVAASHAPGDVSRVDSSPLAGTARG